MYDWYIVLKVVVIDVLINRIDDIDFYGGVFLDIEEVLDRSSNFGIFWVFLYGWKVDVLLLFGR